MIILSYGRIFHSVKVHNRTGGFGTRPYRSRPYDYRQLQLELIRHPEQGKIIPGSGGLRKIRWAPRGRGKSGALRTIYFWAVSDEKIFMLYIYTKNELENPSSDQLKLLRKIIKEEFK